MKSQFIYLLLFLALVLGCKHEPDKQSKDVVNTETASTVSKRDFPPQIKDLFEKHGGYERWAQQGYLQFTLPKPDLPEIHHIALKSRKDLITTDKYRLGFDGQKVWVKQDSAYFGGNPRFYHNLMFYFYAMPFVLGDSGVIYEPAEDLVYKDTVYSGFKISFEDNVGETPEDNYFLYIHPKTGRMAWLGYTVTFFTGQTSDKVSWIHYAGWDEFNGLLLPTRLEWHDYKDGKLGDMTRTVRFTDIKLQENIPENITFSMPESAMVAEK